MQLPTNLKSPKRKWLKGPRREEGGAELERHDWKQENTEIRPC